MGEWIEIGTLTGDGAFGCYRAQPDGAPRAAIVVIQEIFGINPGIRAITDGWAERGYLALAPDLFWRLEPRVERNPDVPEEFQQALATFPKFDQALGITDVEATIRVAREAVGGGKVGCVGYCLGGRLAYMASARTDVDASVGYYGVGIDQLLGEKHAISRPLMLHIPEADHFVGPEAQRAMHEGLDGHSRVTLHDYPGLDHGFAAALGSRRDEAGAQLADGRTVAFFAEHLG